MFEVQINDFKHVINLNHDLVPMKLTTEFSKVNAKIGETIELRCFAEGNPKPKIIWHKVGDSKSELSQLLN